ncbi:MAG TPA: M48 family metallopeptidase [Caulobacter sp.]|nr:M48 family metallopeptidase [Caulobacter sp.]
MGAVGLYTHIQSNNLRSALLLAGFPVLLLGLTYALTLGLIGLGLLPSTGSIDGDLAEAAGFMLAGAPPALIVTAVWFVVAYFGNQVIIDLATGARPATRQAEPDLYNLLENLCISRGLPMPSLRIIESDALNAFATGLNEKQYSITVTRGLMTVLDRAELEAVLAHELTHVINRDVRTMVIASVFAGVITLVAEILFRSIRFGGLGGRRGDRKGAGLFILVAFVAAAVGYVLAIVIRMSLSRSREFVADAGSVELTKNPDAMISALRKIEGHSALPAPESVQGMFIENREEGIYALFATHPPISKRIEALVRFAGGHDSPNPIVAGPGPWG